MCKEFEVLLTVCSEGKRMGHMILPGKTQTCPYFQFNRRTLNLRPIAIPNEARFHDNVRRSGAVSHCSLHIITRLC